MWKNHTEPQQRGNSSCWSPAWSHTQQGFLETQNLGVERMERPASSPDLNPTEHLWDQLGFAVHGRLTSTTTLADLRQMLVEEWYAIPQQCVTSMRRRRHTFVATYGSSTHY